MNLRQMNATDTIVAHAASVAKAGWYFDSVADEALPNIQLSDYALVIWGAGQESTSDETFSTEQQAAIRELIQSGGALWATGSEIFWDLDERGDASDRDFAAAVLGASLAADDAGTETVDGEGVLVDVGPMDFSLDAGAPFPVEYPDALQSDRDVIARYSTGAIAGVLGEQVAVFGFPFESIGDPTTRDEVAAALLPLLVPAYEPPAPTGDIPSGYPRVLLSELGGCACSVGTAPGFGFMSYLWIVGIFARRRRVVE